MGHGPSAAQAQYGAFHTAAPPAPPITHGSSTLPFTGVNLALVLLLAVALVLAGVTLHRLAHRAR